jgi:hypothetical protein
MKKNEYYDNYVILQILLRAVGIIIFFEMFNMENIIRPGVDFDFSKISLAYPSSINGGAYFTKLLCDNNSVYLETQKSKSKQGIVKSGKKIYSDLMFDRSSEETIDWFERLEERCQELLLAKNAEWFEGTLSQDDIDNAFNSVFKVYKSGKFYLLKTNIKSDQSGNPYIKIYNENEVLLGADSITQDTEFISILEIKGIKFTTRSFQLDIDLKQIMVVEKDPLFDNCLIRSNKKEVVKPENNEASSIKETEGVVSVAVAAELSAKSAAYAKLNDYDLPELVDLEVTDDKQLKPKGLNNTEIEELKIEDVGISNSSTNNNNEITMEIKELDDNKVISPDIELVNSINDIKSDSIDDVDDVDNVDNVDNLDNVDDTDGIKELSLDDSKLNVVDDNNDNYDNNTDDDDNDDDEDEDEDEGEQHSNSSNKNTDGKFSNSNTANVTANIKVNTTIKDSCDNNASKDLEDITDNMTITSLEDASKKVGPLKLKDPSSIYLDLYKEAREKAKIAKKNAIVAYLEAKNIKKTFMVDMSEMEDTDSDIDNEIDNVSDSEIAVL